VPIVESSSLCRGEGRGRSINSVEVLELLRKMLTFANPSISGVTGSAHLCLVRSPELADYPSVACCK
jgi:hypothetical protein